MFCYKKNCIKILRESLELTQTEFAERLGVERARAFQLESPSLKPNVSTLEKIMQTFKVKPDFFFEEINDNANVN